MRVLFVHQNFPGQYGHIAQSLASRPDCEVTALAMNRRPSVAGVRTIFHELTRGSSTTIHSLARDFEAKTLRAESTALAALQLKKEGYYPDVICGHPGWGETLLLRDVWPETKILSYMEFFYKSTGADVGFDREFPPLSQEELFKVRLKNAHFLLAMEDSDWLVSPTHWQARQFSKDYRQRMTVLHDGIDTQLLIPDQAASLKFARNNLELNYGDEVITFVNRNLEPYRGYHTFMRSLPSIMRSRPNAHVAIVGGNSVSYGARDKAGRSYKDIFLGEVIEEIDMTRVHFLGQIPYRAYIRLLQISAAHVYLTYPFVLSWSLIEALSVGCAVIGSATEPVQEVIRHQENGLLVDFFSPTEVAEAVLALLANPSRYVGMRLKARQTAAEYDLREVLPKHVNLIQRLVGF